MKTSVFLGKLFSGYLWRNLLAMAIVVALLGVLHWNGSKLIGDCLFCLEWTCVCELVAYLFVYPMEMRFDWLVKRMIRKEERKADYKEAIREMKQSGEWDR